MATAQTDAIRPNPQDDLTPIQALRLAWIWWTVLLLVPFLVFVLVMWMQIIGNPTERPTAGMIFFILSWLWLLVAVPGAFVLRNHVFKSYWEGRVVDPRSYLRGMLTIWVAAEIGGLLALVGCLVGGALLPNLLPAAVAFMLFTPFWPNGRAMTDPVGNTDDDEVFRHPR